MKRLLGSCAVLVLTAPIVFAAEAPVRLTQKPDTLEVTVGGEPFAVYNFGKNLPKPYFWPVRAPGGSIMTRPLENPKDHKHHKGIWLSVDEVNDIKFWAEKGKIENVSLKVLASEGDPAKFEVVNHWQGNDGKPVLVETTTISIFANRVIAYDIQFTPGDQNVTFGDTKEGLFGFRMVDSMREKGGDGKVENAEGLQGTAKCWGQYSDWVDYSGTVEGQTVGVAVFDHPKNFRRSRYHVRDYGLFSISPFGEHDYTNGREQAQLVILPKGKNLRLRYAMYLHAGDTQSAKVAEAYQSYVKAAE